MLQGVARIQAASFAFMESLCIYGLVIALAILFANDAFHHTDSPRIEVTNTVEPVSAQTNAHVVTSVPVEGYDVEQLQGL